MAQLAIWNFGQIGNKSLINLQDSNYYNLTNKGRILKKLIPFKKYGIRIEGTNSARQNYLYILQANASGFELTTSEFTIFTKFQHLKKAGRIMILNKSMFNSVAEIGYQTYVKTDSLVMAINIRDKSDNFISLASNSSLHNVSSDKTMKEKVFYSFKNSSGGIYYKCSEDNNNSASSLVTDNFIGSGDFVIGDNCNNIIESGGSIILELISFTNSYRSDFQTFYNDRVRTKNKSKMKSLSHLLFN